MECFIQHESIIKGFGSKSASAFCVNWALDPAASPAVVCCDRRCWRRKTPSCGWQRGSYSHREHRDGSSTTARRYQKCTRASQALRPIHTKRWRCHYASVLKSNRYTCACSALAWCLLCWGTWPSADAWCEVAFSIRNHASRTQCHLVPFHSVQCMLNVDRRHSQRSVQTALHSHWVWTDRCLKHKSQLVWGDSQHAESNKWAWDKCFSQCDKSTNGKRENVNFAAQCAETEIPRAADVAFLIDPLSTHPQRSPQSLWQTPSLSFAEILLVYHKEKNVFFNFTSDKLSLGLCGWGHWVALHRFLVLCFMDKFGDLVVLSLRSSCKKNRGEIRSHWPFGLESAWRLMIGDSGNLCQFCHRIIPALPTNLCPVARRDLSKSPLHEATSQHYWHFDEAIFRRLDGS